MVIAIIGESCTGKSTLADKLKQEFSATVYTGKDYLRLAKNANEAEKQFEQLLLEASKGANVIYVITEQEHLRFLPSDSFKILVTADLQTIKERFAARMHGNLPKPVADMLEKNHGKFDNIPCEFHYRTVEEYSDLVRKIRGTTYAN